MRYYVTALALALGIAVGAAAYFAREWRSLQAYCFSLAPGASIAQVREGAQAQGFRSSMLPGTQLALEPARWFHTTPPQCLAVFNPSTQLLEHRFWQAR
jgi:hypothetical protein